MSHLLLLPETPRSRCVGTPVFTGENTLALVGCVRGCMRVCEIVFARSRFMQPQFPEKNHASPNESAKFDYDPKVMLRVVSRASLNYLWTEYWTEFANDDRVCLFWDQVRFWNVTKHNELKMWSDISSYVNFYSTFEVEVVPFSRNFLLLNFLLLNLYRTILLIFLPH